MDPARTPVAITMGDACGIGPEIVLKACAERLAVPGAQPLLVYGDAVVLAREARALGLPIDVVTVDGPEAAAGGASAAAAGRIRVPVIACSALPADLPAGRVDARAGAAAHAAIVRASHDAIAGRVRAVVTAPIHKEAIAAAGIRHPGHTEILAELAGVPDVRMMLANDELRTILVTIHVPLREAIAAITREAVRDTIAIADAGLRRLGIARPRIAVAGLNPHAGEGGLMGREEIDTIAPAIADARAAGIDASGPWPGDTVFMRARHFRDFDVVVAMYHDQGLIPVKYLGIDTGVNVTVGLPFVRTSVDHGTAFDIAGQGVADHRSLLAAVDLALRLAPEPAVHPTPDTTARSPADAG
ncbi:MAG: 4-hydroxythreonine-4-phosphate dehydrogenase PdxA [Burkholderiales bacterium]|nr:MAG: 4-hydroxythreonine-4-phosphate dehydrogenase PdxA [Burkholderiales bacterium]